MGSNNDLLQNINLEDEFQVAELQFSKIQTPDDDIITHLEVDAVQENLFKSFQEKDIFYTVLKKMKLCLNKAVMETTSSHTPALPSTSSSTKESDLKVKLPKIELSKFSGQPLKWQRFRVSLSL